jgi:hypothetical protein
VHDSLYESHPTHPLGVRESWPHTGPVYDVPVSDGIEEPPAPTLWQRLTTPTALDGDPSIILPGSLPVWY